MDSREDQLLVCGLGALIARWVSSALMKEGERAQQSSSTVENDGQEAGKLATRWQLRALDVHSPNTKQDGAVHQLHFPCASVAGPEIISQHCEEHAHNFASLLASCTAMLDDVRHCDSSRLPFHKGEEAACVIPRRHTLAALAPPSLCGPRTGPAACLISPPSITCGLSDGNSLRHLSAQDLETTFQLHCHPRTLAISLPTSSEVR